MIKLIKLSAIAAVVTLSSGYASATSPIHVIPTPIAESTISTVAAPATDTAENIVPIDEKVIKHKYKNKDKVKCKPGNEGKKNWENKMARLEHFPKTLEETEHLSGNLSEKEIADKKDHYKNRTLKREEAKAAFIEAYGEKEWDKKIAKYQKGEKLSKEDIAENKAFHKANKLKRQEAKAAFIDAHGEKAWESKVSNYKNNHKKSSDCEIK